MDEYRQGGISYYAPAGALPLLRTTPLRGSVGLLAVVRVGDRGRIYVPREVLDALRIKPGDYVAFRISPDKRIHVERVE